MVIACIDYSNGGHRFFLMYSLIKTIVQSGNTAVCITDDTESIKTRIDNTASLENNKVIYYSHNYTATPNIKWSSRINDISIALNYWKQYNTILKKIEKENSLEIDIVILNYVDVFLSCLMPVFLQKLVFKYRWAGLYVHTRYLRMFKEDGVQEKKTSISDIDYLFTSDKCAGVGVFDNGIHQALENRLGRKVTLMPDITDVSTNTISYELAKEIKSKANNRIIVGSIGLSYYTGTIDLIKLALASTDNKFFFVFCGMFDEESYKYIPSKEDRELLENFRINPTENCIWKEGYLSDEFEYNAVFNILDIVFMMYPEHHTSSNRLTKAAYFNKLVLAANKHCVGKNVVQYHLGEVATPGNITEQADKLNILREKINKKEYPIKEWEAYFSLNNEEMMQKQFKLLLNI